MNSSIAPHWLRMCLALSACCGMLLHGCSGGDAQSGAQPVLPVDEFRPAVAPLELPSPAALLALQRTPVEQGSRAVAYVEEDLEKSGNGYDNELPRQHVVGSGVNTALFSPTFEAPDTTFANLAFCIFRFEVEGYDRSPQVRLAWDESPAEPGNCWVGLSQWPQDSWRWHRNTESGHINVGSLTECFNDDNVLLLVVLLTGGDSATLENVRLGGVPPLPDIDATPLAGQPPLTVTLDASDSEPGEGSITLYEWDPEGDGVFESSTGTTPMLEFTYSANGTYQAALRVTNSVGASATDSTTVHVQEYWQHSFGQSSGEYANAIVPEPDGGFFMVGSMHNPISVGDLLLVVSRLSQAGELLWAKRFSADESVYSVDAALDSDGNLIVAARTDTGGVYGTDVLLQKWSSDAVLQWSKVYGSFDYDNPAEIVLSGNDIFVGGDTLESTERDFFALRVKSSGAVDWSRQRDYMDDHAHAVSLRYSFTHPNESGITVLGYSEPDSGFAQIWRVDWSADGSAAAGYFIPSALGNLYAQELIFVQAPASGDTKFYISGRLHVDFMSSLFLLKMPGSGSSDYGLRITGESFNEVGGMAFDQAGDILLAGGVGLGGPDELKGFLVKLQRSDGLPLSTLTFESNNEFNCPLNELEVWHGGLLICGAAENASATWEEFTPSVQLISGSWFTADGEGTNIDWFAREGVGNVNDLAESLTIDNGGGSSDLFVAFRETP